MEFKIGELVRVRKDLVVGKRYGNDDFTGEMKKYKGKIFNIIKTTKSGIYYLEGCDWYCFTDEMLEKVNPDDLIKQFLDENKEVFKNYDVNFSVTPKPQILDEAEKHYLSNIIRPFRDRVVKITKNGNSYENKYEYINLLIRSIAPGISTESITFTYFESNTMYKGMEVGKAYTLEELGL